MKEFKKRVSKLRGKNPEDVKLGKLNVDAGQGTLKIGLSLLFKDDPVFSPVAEPSRKRSKYADGLESKDFFKDDGVNRCLILAISDRTKEDYETLSDFLGRLNLDPG